MHVQSILINDFVIRGLFKTMISIILESIFTTYLALFFEICSFSVNHLKFLLLETILVYIFRDRTSLSKKFIYKLSLMSSNIEFGLLWWISFWKNFAWIRLRKYQEKNWNSWKIILYYDEDCIFSTITRSRTHCCWFVIYVKKKKYTSQSFYFHDLIFAYFFFFTNFTKSMKGQRFDELKTSRKIADGLTIPKICNKIVSRSENSIEIALKWK